MRKLTTCFLFAVIAFSALFGSSVQDEATILSQVTVLLNAYSTKNIQIISGLVDPGEILMLGTDRSEVADTWPKVRALLEGDFKLWGTSSFGAPLFKSIRMDKHLATVAFDAPFTMNRANGQSDTTTVRFLTVWRLTKDGWKLSQSLNSVPTIGQSANDILNRLNK